MDRDEAWGLALSLLRGGRPEGVAEWNRRKAKLADSMWSARIDLSELDLARAVLRDVDLRGTTLRMANLSGAILDRVNLSGADFAGARLNGSKMSNCHLAGVVFFGADLTDAVIEECILQYTDFSYVDLSSVQGLDTSRISGPCSIGIDTLIASKGKIPTNFLHECGVPDAWIKYLPTMIGEMEPIQFHSCFISYSTADEEFAGRLYNDFQAAGIRCWKWDHDARIGRPLWGEIDRAIRLHDKLVLIASKSSLESPAVNREIERAIRQEDERAKKEGADADVLFPVRLDDYIFEKWEHERKVDVTKKVIADARGWDTDAKVYAKVRDGLIRGLKAEDTKGSSARGREGRVK
jgi:hypothetical protein